MRVVALAVGLGIGLAAAAGIGAHERITTTVTWDREISAIVKARCVTCHSDGGRAPMSLATYAEARPWARAIRHEVMTRRMPIWHAARGYGDFANDPSLSPFEIALVAAWVDGGAPRSFVPRGSPAIRLPGPSETPLSADVPAPPPHPGAREVSVPCGETPVPAGRLVGFRPQLREHASARILVRLPTGLEESLGWITNFDPEFPETYWLRSPLVLPAGSRIHVASTAAAPFLIESSVSGGPCRITLVMARGLSAR
jgi:mono/diheme cytochrome c family protein